MKLPRTKFQLPKGALASDVSAYHFRTWDFFMGLAYGSAIGTGAAKVRSGGEDGWVIIGIAVLFIALTIMVETMLDQRRRRDNALIEEAKYMHGLFEKGIDVGSPDFDLVTTDHQYRA